MSARTQETPATAPVLRIGEVAERAGTTPRTVRYYEEIGLLPGSHDRAHGQHRLYSEADVERLEQILRLKQLLGLSLDELRELLAAEDARAVLREKWQGAEDAGERRAILAESSALIGRQLELVRGRQSELRRLERELSERLDRNAARLAEIDAQST